MADPTLQRIWAVREEISRECDYDSRKLVRYYRELQKADKRAKIYRPEAADRDLPAAETDA